MNLQRLMPLPGIAFVALAMLSFVLGDSTPDNTAPAATVASFYHAHQARQTGAAFALVVAALFLVLFTVALVSALWPAGDGQRPVWEILLCTGGALTGAAILVGATVHFALADGATHVSGAALQALNLVDGDIWVAFTPALGVMMLGAAGTVLTRATGRRWLGWCALVLGIALFVPFANFFAMLATALWIVVASLALVRQPAPARSADRSRVTGTAVPRQGSV
jgi:hypothetical protein